MSTLPPPNKGGALAKLAGILCNDSDFREFLNRRWADEGPYATAEDAAVLVRRVCEVEKRSKLDHDQAAADRFHDRIRIPFVNWKLGRDAQS